MIRHYRHVLEAVGVFGLVFVGSACAPSRGPQFTTPVVPPAPAAIEPDYLIAEPPELRPRLHLREAPQILTLASMTRAAEIDIAIRTADERFQAGKFLYQQGDIGGSRSEFDRAIDALLSVRAEPPDRQRVETKYEQLVESIYSLDVEELGAGDANQEPVYDKSPLDDILEMTFPIDPKLKPRVREEVAATVSQLPLEVNDAVLGYINYFSTDRGRKTIATGLRRAGRYRPLIQRILDEEGLPQELIFLAQAESGFLPRAISRKRATGMWQFVLARGREYDLVQTRYTDDRLDPEKATRAAARHLRDLYQHFGDWYLAIAAYNCGPGRVDSAVERTGYADFWELRKRNVLPRQTANYVPIILAMTIMAKNPRDYRLDDVVPDPPLEFGTVVVSAATSLALIADVVDRPLSELKEMNPAILKGVAPAGYQVRVPRGTANFAVAAMETIPPERRASWRVHRVESGETLAQIAKLYRTSAQSIATANEGVVDAPEAGDFLVIPVSGSTSSTSSRSRRSTTHRKAPVRKSSPRASLRAPQQRHSALRP